MNMVRDRIRPPTFPRACAALDSARTSLRSLLMRKTAVALCCAALAAAAGCKSAVDAQGEFSTPRETVSGGISATTNSVTVSGDFQTGTTNVGAAVTIQK